MERGMRKVPRSGERACRTSLSGKYPESGTHGLCGSQRHLYSVSFARAPSDDSHRRQVLRLARGVSGGTKATGFLEIRRAYAGRAEFHLFPRGHSAQESDARQRLRAKCDVSAWDHMLQLPRRTWHGQLCSTNKTGRQDLFGLPRSLVGQWTSHRDTRRAYTSQGRQHRKPMRRMPHAADRDNDRGR